MLPPFGHHLLGALGDRGERIAGDVHRHREILGRRVDIAALELLLVGEGDGVDDEIEAVPFRAELGEGGVDASPARTTSQSISAAGLSGCDERRHALLERVALIGEGEFGAGLCSASAMPQAMERSLATPMIRPRLPFIRPLST